MRLINLQPVNSHRDTDTEMMMRITHHKVNTAAAHVRLVHQRQGRIRLVDVRCPAGDQHLGGAARIEVRMMPQTVRVLQRNRVVLRARHKDEVHRRDGRCRLGLHRFGRNGRRAQHIDGAQHGLDRIAGHQILAGREQLLGPGQNGGKGARNAVGGVAQRFGQIADRIGEGWQRECGARTAGSAERHNYGDAEQRKGLARAGRQHRCG